MYLFQAQQELANEGMDPDVDKTRAFKKLATTLTKLLGRLEKAEKGRILSVRTSECPVSRVGKQVYYNHSLYTKQLRI